MAILLYTLLVLLLLTLALLAWLVVRTGRDAPDRDALIRLQTREADFQETARLLQEQSKRIEALQVENARLTAELDHERRTAAEKMRLLQDAEARLKGEFENLANRIFEDKGRTLTEQNRERISSLLQPLREQLDGFRKRVDEVHKDDTEQSARLLEQVRQLQTLSNKVSDEANHLARAIKGDAKRQGDWGELIVERLLEASGLESGREYETQPMLRTESGAVQRPDFVVHLPGNKSVIVDAKVSLTAYERSCNAANDDERRAALTAHVQSVRRHINELRDKNYATLLGNRTLDFVLMCIPLEPAYQAALQMEPGLLYELAKTNVVITGPSTLMITLKLIAQIWRRENENRHAEQIADRAGRLYDQVTLIVEAMAAAKKNLGDVAQCFDLALARLQNGRGNLVGRVEALRKLGAKVNKPLPPAVVERALATDGSADDDGDESPVPPSAIDL